MTGGWNISGMYQFCTRKFSAEISYSPLLSTHALHELAQPSPLLLNLQGALGLHYHRILQTGVSCTQCLRQFFLVITNTSPHPLHPLTITECSQCEYLRLRPWPHDILRSVWVCLGLTLAVVSLHHDTSSLWARQSNLFLGVCGGRGEGIHPGVDQQYQLLT